MIMRYTNPRTHSLTDLFTARELNCTGFRELQYEQPQ